MKRGFTLVEMAIVLVIVGLLIGGVLGGKELKSAATRTSVISGYNSFRAAFFTFSMQYDCLPGDCANATEYWGEADNGDGAGADCVNTISTDKKTCNGDGNEIIDIQTATLNEKLRTWQHLSNAELIDGFYTGAFNGSGAMETGVNTPGIKFSKAAWEFAYLNGGLYGVIDHFLKIGGITGGTGLNNSGLSSQDAFLIDDKIDDGVYNTGFFMANTGWDGASACIVSSAYNRNESRLNCRVYMVLQN